MLNKLILFVLLCHFFNANLSTLSVDDFETGDKIIIFMISPNIIILTTNQRHHAETLNIDNKRGDNKANQSCNYSVIFIIFFLQTPPVPVWSVSSTVTLVAVSHCPGSVTE